MGAILPYIATAVAALGLLIVLAARQLPARLGGGVLGLAGLAWWGGRGRGGDGEGPA